MSPTSDNKNRILSKISVAAQTALLHPRRVEFSHFIGRGLSIRARARLAIAAAFIVALPTMLIGVIRTEDVAQHAATLGDYDDYWKRLLETRIALKELDLAMWAYSAEQEFENGQAVLAASDYFKHAINQLVLERPLGLDIGPRGFFEGLALRLDSLIKRAIANRGGLSQARLSILSIAKELKTVEMRVVLIANKEKKAALGSLSMVGRDQLILFLILLFAIPVFVLFIPSLIVVPVNRLRQIASKIELGQLKEMPVHGRDEAALLARTLKSYFLRKEESDHKKSSKIFEIRNVLRAVLNRVNEPVFIVDGSTRINYTNEAAALFLGLRPHQMEGRSLADCLYSPLLKKAVVKAFAGDDAEDVIETNIEIADGRSFLMLAKIGMVRNRDGDISRVVIVLHEDHREPNHS